MRLSIVVFFKYAFDNLLIIKTSDVKTKPTCLVLNSAVNLVRGRKEICAAQYTEINVIITSLSYLKVVQGMTEASDN